MARDHQTGKRYALDPSHRFGPNLNDVATAGGFGDLPVLPTPMARDHRPASPAEALRNSPGLSSIGALLTLHADDLPVLPTPMASLSEHRRDSGADPEKRRAKGKQVSLADEVCYLPGQRDGAQVETKLKLLPTPTTSDSRGASCGGAHN